MLHHFRFLMPLLERDGDGLTPLHYYDSAMQIARNSNREPTEQEFRLGMNAANIILRMYVLKALSIGRLNIISYLDSRNAGWNW
jgi:hypothetical protein